MRLPAALLVATLLANAAAGAVLLTPAVAEAQVPGKEHARKLFDEGLDLEKKGDHPAALARFEEASQIAATPGVRFHKAYCLEMLGKLAAALEEYEAAERVAREQGRGEVRSAVVARLEPLRGRVPQIAIRLGTPVKDAIVELDGVAVGAPLLDGRSFRLDPGEHVVTARAPHHRNLTRTVKVPEGVTTSVDLLLDPEAGAPGGRAPGEAPRPAADLTEPPREAARSRSLVAPILATSGAVLFAAAGVAAFAVAGSKASDAEVGCLRRPSCESERDDVRTFDALALASFGAAVGLGVIAVVLWASPGGRAATSVASPAASPARPEVRLHATPTSVGFEGRF